MEKRFTVYAAAVAGLFFLLAAAVTFFPAGAFGEYAPSLTPPPEPYRMAGQSAPGRVEINSATLLDILHLPYLTFDQKSEIIALRELLGGFDSLEQLCFIKGIGPARLDMLAEYLYIEKPSITI